MILPGTWASFCASHDLAAAQLAALQARHNVESLEVLEFASMLSHWRAQCQQTGIHQL